MKLNIVNPRRELLLKSRILMTINGCHYCRMYLAFIQKLNAKLSIDKRITVINCSNYHDYDIVDDKRIPIFLKYYQGSYPTLFIDGSVIRGANSQIELEAWIRSRLVDNFELDEELGDLIFDKQCRYIKNKWFGRHLECR